MLRSSVELMPLLLRLSSYELIDYLEYMLKDFSIERATNPEVHKKIDELYQSFEEDSENGKIVSEESDSLLPEGMERYDPELEGLEEVIDISSDDFDLSAEDIDGFDPQEMSNFLKNYNF